MTNKLLTHALTLGEFNSLQALSGLDDWAVLRVPWEVATEDCDEIPLLYLMHFLRMHAGGNPQKDTPYARLLDYLEDRFFEESGL